MGIDSTRLTSSKSEREKVTGSRTLVHTSTEGELLKWKRSELLSKAVHDPLARLPTLPTPFAPTTTSHDLQLSWCDDMSQFMFEVEWFETEPSEEVKVDMEDILNESVTHLKANNYEVRCSCGLVTLLLFPNDPNQKHDAKLGKNIKSSKWRDRVHLRDWEKSPISHYHRPNELQQMWNPVAHRNCKSLWPRSRCVKFSGSLLRVTCTAARRDHDEFIKANVQKSDSVYHSLPKNDPTTSPCIKSIAPMNHIFQESPSRICSSLKSPPSSPSIMEGLLVDVGKLIVQHMQDVEAGLDSQDGDRKRYPEKPIHSFKKREPGNMLTKWKINVNDPTFGTFARATLYSARRWPSDLVHISGLVYKLDAHIHSHIHELVRHLPISLEESSLALGTVSSTLTTFMHVQTIHKERMARMEKRHE
ncbi:hypothetical protein H5410_046897 [Solanum commersonii]|uniref:Uncharacterized protein n=1 Tax=Solanum commersonii TaxID=4109 RepID=A0A9J5XFP3_SOLCO|nr:hypothetical protein H5410_046897 [Solanum commersonii]